MKQELQKLNSVVSIIKKPHKKLAVILLFLGIALSGYFFLAKPLSDLRPLEASEQEIQTKISNYMGCIDFCEESFRQVVDLGPRVVPPLIEIVSKSLSDSQANDRAIELLGALGDQSAQGVLLEAAKHSSPGTRSNAIVALGNLGGEKAYDSAIIALGDTDSGVRENAAKVLVRIGSPKAIPDLEKAFADEKKEFLQKVFLGSINTLEPLTIEKVKERSLPEVMKVSVGFRTADIFLFARNQIISTRTESSCAGERGVKEYKGDYQLVVALGGKIISSEFVGKDLLFVENQIHDGIKTFTEPTTQQRLISIYQYGSCQTKLVNLFQLNSDGLIKKLHFIKKIDNTSSISDSEKTGHDGRILVVEGKPTFCEFNDSTRTFFCNQYAYDGRFNFNGLKSWESQKLPEPHESIIILSDVPSVYSDCSGQELSLEKTDLDDVSLRYDNTLFINKDLNKQLSGYSKLGGKAWVCQWRALSRDRLNEIRDGFEEYYKTEFSRRGWQYSLKTNNFEFKGAAGDSPNGSMWGYLAENNGKLRAVAFSWFVSGEGSLDLTVFFSDIVTVSSISP